MANTTFSGPVISNAGFQVSAVTLGDADATLTKAANAGRINFIGDNSADRTYTLPAPEAGVSYRFVYSGGASDATDAIIQTPGNSNFFKGNITFLDEDGTGAEVAAVFPDGDSNSKLQINVPDAFDITIMGLDSTNYQIFGTITAITAPTFADQ
jgi:hypothetical protein